MYYLLSKAGQTVSAKHEPQKLVFNFSKEGVYY